MSNARKLANLLGGGAFNSVGIDDNADATAITIDSSERVGIGTTSPATQLHIDEGTSNSYGTLRLEGNNRGGDIEMYQGTVPVSTIRTDQSGNMYFKTSGAYGNSSVTTKLAIATVGNVGIGTDSPQDIFHAYLASGQRVARFESNDNTSAHIAFKAPNTSYMPTVGVKDEDFYISTGDAVERLRLKASNGDLVSSQRFLITNEVNASYTPNATGFGWQNPRDVDSFADITNMAAGLNYVYDSARFPGWGHTDNVAKTHWGAIVLVGYSGAGQGYYLIAYGYATSPTVLYSANWTGNAVGSASVSGYFLRLTKSTTGSHNVWAMNIGV